MAMKTNTIRDIDKGYSKLFRTLGLAGKSVLTVGIHQKEGAAPKKTIPRSFSVDRSGNAELHESQEQKPAQTLADVASHHELGQGVPRRSFIADTFDIKLEENKRAIAHFGRQMLSGKMTEKEALTKLGLKFRGDIQKRIAAGILPANSERTIAQKGSSTPLIATGQLRAGISFEVKPGSGAR